MNSIIMPLLLIINLKFIIRSIEMEDSSQQQHCPQQGWQVPDGIGAKVSERCQRHLVTHWTGISSSKPMGWLKMTNRVTNVFAHIARGNWMVRIRALVRLANHYLNKYGVIINQTPGRQPSDKWWTKWIWITLSHLVRLVNGFFQIPIYIPEQFNTPFLSQKHLDDFLPNLKI